MLFDVDDIMKRSKELTGELFDDNIMKSNQKIENRKSNLK